MPSTVLITVALAALSGAAAPEEIVATYRAGEIHRGDLAVWIAHRVPGPAPADPDPELLEELVLLRTLDAIFDERGLGAAEVNQARIELMSWDQQASWLRRKIQNEAKPSDVEVRAAYQVDPKSFAQPKRWRLQNIFKRWPGDSETSRNQLRQEMAEIRQRVLDGEDFRKVARIFSDSETRSRGGQIGAVRPEQLAPPIAEAVREMGPNDLSEVIESAEGLTLIRCTEVIPAVEPTLDGARGKIAKRLGRERFDRVWDGVTARLLRDSEPRYMVDSITGTATPDTTVATIRIGDDRNPIPLADFQVFLRMRKVRRPAHELSAETLQTRLEERVLLEGRARAAELHGIASDPEFVVELGWKIKELRARIALDDEVTVSQTIPDPTQEEVKALYQNRQAELVEPERLRLWALRVEITADQPAAFYAEVRQLGIELAEGRTEFDDAAEALAPHVQKVDLGWLTRDQVWMMGRNVNDAVNGLEPGATSRAVQEGKRLYILHMEERREKRLLSLEEAEPRLRAAMLQSRRARAEETVRQRIIDQQEITMGAADRGPANGAGGR